MSQRRIYHLFLFLYFKSISIWEIIFNYSLRWKYFMKTLIKTSRNRNEKTASFYDKRMKISELLHLENIGLGVTKLHEFLNGTTKINTNYVCLMLVERGKFVTQSSNLNTI